MRCDRPRERELEGAELEHGGVGAVRFAWCFTPNWIYHSSRPVLPVQGAIQFVEVKGGEVSDLTEYGGGYRKKIKR